jgi:hypothetical protein
MRRLGLCVITALAGSFARFSGAQRPAPAVVVVTVGDAASHDFLADVEVRVAGTSISGRTDSAGEARLRSIEPGPHEIEARRVGYAPRSAVFTARAGDTLSLLLLLLQRAVRPLDTIRVTAVARKAFLLGFEERRQAAPAHSYFLDEAQLDSTRWLNDLPAALARRLPWLTVRLDENIPVLHTTHRGECGPIVFLDGHELMDRKDLWAIMARELAGVEFYDDGAKAPTLFQRPRIGVHLCSILLLWSR